MQCDKIDVDNLYEILDVVELEVVLVQLEYGIDTRIASSGWPLSVMEITRLKLAAAIIAQPRILVLGEMFDLVPRQILKRAFDRLQESSVTTILHCSWKRMDMGYNYQLNLEADSQKVRLVDNAPSSEQ